MSDVLTGEQQVRLLAAIEHMQLDDFDEQEIMRYCAHQIQAWGIPLTMKSAYEVHCLMKHPHRHCIGECTWEVVI